MSGYTVQSMMADAEKRHHAATSTLNHWAGAAATAQKAIAEALNGLLAVELAKYAAGAGWPKDDTE